MVKYSHLEFEEKLKSKYGNRFTLLSEYTTAQGYVLVKCNECGEISEKQAVKLLQRGTCNGCAIKRHTKTHEEFTACCRKAPSFSYGDIRQIQRSHCVIYATVG